jgi:hypothetical protein
MILGDTKCFTSFTNVSPILYYCNNLIYNKMNKLIKQIIFFTVCILLFSCGIGLISYIAEDGFMIGFSVSISCSIAIVIICYIAKFAIDIYFKYIQ